MAAVPGDHNKMHTSVEPHLGHDEVARIQLAFDYRLRRKVLDILVIGL